MECFAELFYKEHSCRSIEGSRVIYRNVMSYTMHEQPRGSTFWIQFGYIVHYLCYPHDYTRVEPLDLTMMGKVAFSNGKRASWMQATLLNRRQNLCPFYYIVNCLKGSDMLGMIYDWIHGNRTICRCSSGCSSCQHDLLAKGAGKMSTVW